MVFQSMALGMILAVAAVAISAITLLPVVLLAMGDRVRRTPKTSRTGRASIPIGNRLASAAIARPGLSLAGGLLVLGLLVLPALGMRLGMPDARVVDEGRSSRTGYELMVAAFGEGAAGPIFITVDAAESDLVLAAASADSRTLAASVVTEPSESGRVVVRVTPREGVASQDTMDLVGSLRSDLDQTAPSARVGGPAGQNHDLTSVLTGRAPWAVLLIMIGAFLLILVVFRSPVIALVSVLLDVLSVAAAFGFATIVFQNGFGANLIGIQEQGFVNAWAPIFFFALLFGLSMDYQLFLLAAIRERYEQTGDNAVAVRDGITRTGKPITNAALIMIVVFIAFGVTGPIPPTELGITLAFAVLLDATLVRMILVPSIMTLLGERNWWLPAWLDRRLPQVDFSH
jgi:RND superfamily putative drug exporter